MPKLTHLAAGERERDERRQLGRERWRDRADRVAGEEQMSQPHEAREIRQRGDRVVREVERLDLILRDNALSGESEHRAYGPW